MPTVLFGSTRPGSFILTESERTISRDNVLLSGATVIAPATVLGQITSSGSFVPLNPSANDGSQNAAAISIYKVDTTGGDVKGAVIARSAEVIAPQLVWPVGISGPQMAAALAQLKALPGGAILAR